MNVRVPTSDTSFIERQRRSLLKLRMALLAAAQNDEDEEADIKRESLERDDHLRELPRRIASGKTHPRATFTSAASEVSTAIGSIFASR